MEPTMWLERPGGHTLAIYERGNPDGVPVFYLHGGPGGCIQESSFSFFDLFRFHVIAFDQRGCGKSTPFAGVEQNDIGFLVEDVEAIRERFGWERIALFGGSFGTTLALAYAIAHPDRVRAMVLRGIFLGRQEDIDWLYEPGGAAQFFPEAYAKFTSMEGVDLKSGVVRSYEAIFAGDDTRKKREAAMRWSAWERGIVRLDPPAVDFFGEPDDADISLARLECLYFARGLGWDGDNYILDHIDAIADIKTVILHGRYDVDCRPSGAWALYKSLRNARIEFPVAGHSPADRALGDALIRATEDLLSDGKFRHLEIPDETYRRMQAGLVHEVHLPEAEAGDTLIVRRLGTEDCLRATVAEVSGKMARIER